MDVRCSSSILALSCEYNPFALNKHEGVRGAESASRAGELRQARACVLHTYPEHQSPRQIKDWGTRLQGGGFPRAVQTANRAFKTT